AHDSDQAWQQLSPEVSLVLLDIMMPGENGPEVLRRMRLDPMLAQVPVIFVTARSDAATRIQCFAMGAQGFVVKPFRSAQLMSIVRSVIDRAERDPSTEAELDPIETALGLDTDAAPHAGLELRNGSGLYDPGMIQGLLAERQATRLTLASHRRLVSALFRLHQLINACIEPERVARGIVQLASKVLNAARTILWVRSGDVLRPLGAFGDASDPDELPLDGASLPARTWREWLTVEEEHAASG